VQQILIDACGWVAIIDSGMNIDSELSRVYGPAQMLLLDSVREELELLTFNGQEVRTSCFHFWNKNHNPFNHSQMSRLILMTKFSSWLLNIHCQFLP
jgi:rRNA-processing protein FCF1